MTNTNGKDLADVDIRVNNTQFYNNSISGETDANGRYSPPLTPGAGYVR
ncbi:MAG: hypothetical protein U0X91_01975 [Spirosomataceae bacterium]